MSKTRWTSLLVSGVAAVAIALGPSTQALADTVDADQLPEDVHVAPDVDLSKPIVPSTDDPGKSGKLSTDATAAACGPYAGYGPPWSWAQYEWTDCSYWGWDSTATKYYSWWMLQGSDSQACTQGMGYGASGPYWRGTGCGTSGGGSLHWGEVVGVPKYKVTSIAVPLGAPTYWQ